MAILEVQVEVPGLPEVLVGVLVADLLEVEVLVAEILGVVQLEDLPAWLPWLRNGALTPRPGGGTSWQSDRNVAWERGAVEAPRLGGATGRRLGAPTGLGSQS